MMNYSKTAVLFLGLVFSVIPSLYAQQSQGTLGTVWSSVAQNYVGVHYQESLIQAASLQEQAVRTQRLPQLKTQFQNTYGTFEGSPGAFFPQAGFFNVSGSNNPLSGSAMTANTFGSALIDWELVSFGRIAKDNKRAETMLQKQRSDKDSYILKLKKIVTERFITLVYTASRSSWTAKNVLRLDEIRQITASLSASGLRPAADSLLAYSSFVQSLGEQDKWRGQQQAAYIKLKELYPEGPLAYDSSLKNFIEPPLDMERAIDQTVPQSHPILESLERQAKVYQMSAETQFRSAWPSIRLLGGYAYRGTGIQGDGQVSGAWSDGFKQGTNNLLLGLGMTWNISSLYTHKFKGNRMLKEAQAVQQLHQQYEQAMQADLRASQANIQEQFNQVQKSIIAVRQVQEAYHMYLARYKSGLISLSELLQIRLLLEQAEQNQLEASRAYWLQLSEEAELTENFDFLFNHL